MERGRGRETPAHTSFVCPSVSLRCVVERRGVQTCAHYLSVSPDFLPKLWEASLSPDQRAILFDFSSVRAGLRSRRRTEERARASVCSAVKGVCESFRNGELKLFSSSFRMKPSLSLRISLILRLRSPRRKVAHSAGAAVWSSMIQTIGCEIFIPFLTKGCVAPCI